MQFSKTIGDSGSISTFVYAGNPALCLLIFLFSFFIVIYLMNLFIGLLNLSIKNYNTDVEYLLLKAKVLYFNDYDYNILTVLIISITILKSLFQKLNYFICYPIINVIENGFQTGCMYSNLLIHLLIKYLKIF
jgi:hypothetical protein